MGEITLVLFLPALAGYAQAAVAYVAAVARPGRLARHAIWGVRFGWLAQTGLLIAQAARADGFAWGSWSGSLNLFVWMSVALYLIWGCRPPYRLLGLVVMPPAAALLGLAWVVGGIDDVDRGGLGGAFVALHVGLVIAAFAGFALAASVAGLYLWLERRLKRHSPSVLRGRAPGLATLDRILGRTIAFSLPALTLGVGIGFARLGTGGGSFDPVMGVTLLAWLVYAAFLVARHELGWVGRRGAYMALAGFLLVVAIRVGYIPIAHS